MTELRAGESYRVELPEFEGPLDLLLHLCKTHEIDIVKLPIAFVTEKYLEYLDVMQTLSVDVAADYLVMAATLAYLKSRELVPAPEALEATDEEGGEEALDPREELIRRLLEYQKYKNAAALLGERPIEGRNIFGRGMEMEGDNAPAPLADHSVWKLIEAFGRLLEKAGPKVTHEVKFDRVSIGSRINQLIDRLELQRGAMRFDELFDLKLSEVELRSQLVVTLLAILELARLKVVRVLASEQDETLIIAQVEGAQLEEARRARVTSDAESIIDEAAAEQGREEDGEPETTSVTATPAPAAEPPAEPREEPEAELQEQAAAAVVVTEPDIVADSGIVAPSPVVVGADVDTVPVVVEPDDGAGAPEPAETPAADEAAHASQEMPSAPIVVTEPDIVANPGVVAESPVVVGADVDTTPVVVEPEDGVIEPEPSDEPAVDQAAHASQENHEET